MDVDHRCQHDTRRQSEKTADRVLLMNACEDFVFNEQLDG